MGIRNWTCRGVYIVLFFLGNIIPREKADLRSNLYKESVEAGDGKFAIIDPATGKVEFVWFNHKNKNDKKEDK